MRPLSLEAQSPRINYYSLFCPLMRALFLGGVFMGFKCPVCMQDFGRRKPEWQKHISTEHKGVGSDILDALKKVTGDKKTRGG